MRTKIFLPLFFSTVFSLQNIFAQTYYVPMTGSLGPFNACSGIFYDSQLDPSVNYTNNQNGTVTICSALAGQYVSITFSSMALADNTDILRLYSGAGTGGPLLQIFTGPINTTSFSSAVVSQDVSGGCITGHFQTGSAGVAAGWNATIACQLTTGVSEPQSSNNSNIAILHNTDGSTSFQFYSNTSSAYAISIFSADGKNISQKNYSLGAGQHQISLSTQNLPQGIYFCRVEGEGINKSFKFIK
ncbi:MAG TPA: T9SS type A sorting domain-containing protein [Bacteroidia bacterium]|nr:T9SS type A sorting domain-containing protein [Bacteroidia bacterium]